MSESGHLLGISTKVMPTRPIDNAPITVQLYAGRFRGFRVVQAAEIIEAAFGSCAPVDPLVV